MGAGPVCLIAVSQAGGRACVGEFRFLWIYILALQKGIYPMKGLRPLCWLLLVSVLAGCSSSKPVDLAFKVKAGDSIRYEVKETMTASVVGKSSTLRPISGTTELLINVGAVDGSQANAVCVVGMENGNQWPIPVVLDTQTGGTTIRENSLRLTPAQLDLFYDRYMVALGARPGDARTGVGDRWQGEMRQLPFGGVVFDPIQLPLTLELTEVTDSLATVRIWGERKLDWEAEGKMPERFVGTMSATGTMVINLDLGLVESSEIKVITRLKNSRDGKETEGSNTIEVRRVGQVY